jgi:hypothetical protein
LAQVSAALVVGRNRLTNLRQRTSQEVLPSVRVIVIHLPGFAPLPDQSQRVIRHRAAQTPCERAVVREAAQLSAPMALRVTNVLNKVAWSKTFGATVGLGEPGLEHMAPARATLRLSCFIEVEQRGERNLPPALRRHDEGHVAALDPPLEAGVADTEQLSSEGPRDRVAQLLLECCTDRDDVATVPGLPLGAAQPSNLFE